MNGGFEFFLFYVELLVMVIELEEFYFSLVFYEFVMLDCSVVGQVFMYLLVVFDCDGDVLVYQLLILKLEEGIILGYQEFMLINFGFNNQLMIDVGIGLFVWDVLQWLGWYLINIMVSIYWDGVFWEQVICDMLIEVEELMVFFFVFIFLDEFVLQEVQVGDVVELEVVA